MNFVCRIELFGIWRVFDVSILYTPWWFFTHTHTHLPMYRCDYIWYGNNIGLYTKHIHVHMLTDQHSTRCSINVAIIMNNNYSVNILSIRNHKTKLIYARETRFSVIHLQYHYIYSFYALIGIFEKWYEIFPKKCMYT